MKHIKLVLASGAILLSGALCQSVHASIVESGTSTLVNAFGIEPLTVTWSVTELGSIYTYDYTVNNPLGDVKLTDTGAKTTTPETVDYFSVGFDTTVPGAYILLTQAGGNVAMANNGSDGLTWQFSPIDPGTSSPTLSFESSLYPGLASANASDHNPPSPWASVPGGQLVPAPVPVAVPEPTTVISGVLLLLPFGASTLRILRKNRAA